jgi:hypothetical protein
MSNVHVISNDGKIWNAIFHIAIPSANNAAGVPWATVMLRNGYGKTSLPDGDGTLGTISASEKTGVLAGSVIEVPYSFKFNASPSLAELDAIYLVAKAQLINALQAKYNYYGVTR